MYRVKNRNSNYGTTQNLTAGDNLLFRLSFGGNWQDVHQQLCLGACLWYPRNEAINTSPSFMSVITDTGRKSRQITHTASIMEPVYPAAAAGTMALGFYSALENPSNRCDPPSPR